RYRDVLLHRPIQQQPGNGDPNPENDRGADHKTRRVQIKLFLTKRVARCHDGRIHPWVKIPKAKENRCEQNCEQRQIANGRFKKPSHGVAPTPSSKMVDHQQPKRAKRKPEKEEVPEEECYEKFARRRNPANHASGQADDADEQRNSFRATGRSVDDQRHLWPSSFARSAGSASDKLAWWLSCKART